MHFYIRLSHHMKLESGVSFPSLFYYIKEEGGTRWFVGKAPQNGAYLIATEVMDDGNTKSGW